uniref:GDSL-like Lipase/Acylhydrolase n=1 Tax=Desulfovibrio sp. U5L TaxID=596152 RepID=I2Q3S6_9BACT
MKKLYVASFFIVIFFTFLVLEVGTRAYFCLQPGGKAGDFFSSNGGTYCSLPFSEYDPELGWKTSSNYRANVFFRDENDNFKTTQYTTYDFGFRKFGNIESNKPKVFIVGDSFTHAINVDDSKTYYSKLDEICEVFVYGASGYGAYQEYLILKKYVDLIRPDIIIIQFCGNDVSDGYLPLERLSLYNNQGQIRPYIGVDSSPYMAIPARNYFEKTLLFGNIVTKYSRFIFSLYQQLSRLSLEYMKLTNNYFESSTPSSKINMLKQEGYASVSNAYSLIKMLKKCKLAVITTQDDLNLKKYCDAQGIELIDSHIKVFKEMLDNGKKVYGPDNYHWNDLGHEIVHQAVSGYIQKQISSEVPIHP